jgi:sterol desaturase/sphingolipid hydroxylase (fatty acid hydroxylase superfamily)
MVYWTTICHWFTYVATGTYYWIKDSIHERQSRPSRWIRFLEASPMILVNMMLNTILIETFQSEFTLSLSLSSLIVHPPSIQTEVVPSSYSSKLYLYECLRKSAGLSLAFLLCVLLADCWFYIGHRFCHWHSWFYKHIHKLHHVYSEPMGITAFDSHPIEHLLLNILSVAMGPLVFFYIGYPFTENQFLQWIVFVTMNSVRAHSSYSIHHYNHHKYLFYNYGQGTYVLDILLGTFMHSPSK